jgi:starch-binding outer membrane protein, SusD/RagB family
MKFYKVITAFILIFALGACENELEIQPESTLTYNGFWESEEAASAAQVGLYAKFRDLNLTFWTLGEVRSDIWGGPTLESPSNLNLINQNISSTLVPFGNWAGFYGYIHQLNDFLFNIEGIEFSNEDAKNHLIGQVHGLRAYVYYTMLKTWGKVPITTEPLIDANPSELARARSSREEVMELIKSDLSQSLEAFGDDESFWNNQRIYWSKAATLTLKGDVYIWSGKLLGGGDSDYTEAKFALEEVRGMNLELLDNYNDLWGEENENNNEFIFKIDYTQGEAGNFYNGLFSGGSGGLNAIWDDRGNSMSDFVSNGGNRYGPSLKTLETIDDMLDARRDGTFIRLYNNDDGHIPFDTEGYLASILRKFLGVIEAGTRLSNNDVPIYRYADVILLLAEAKNNLGEDPTEEINQIRMRAYGDNYDETVHAYVDAGQVENTRAILEERLKEFIGEGKRWWDLRRAGGNFIFEEVESLDQSEAYKLELPITPAMIANNPLLEQTEGY